uniref:MAM domain containing 4 n=1 Tax=Chelonoidis abingdonii TaxID=106734 RepID=A0A8C0IJA5_CHEAB
RPCSSHWPQFLANGSCRVGSIFINRCSSPAPKVCDFVCDCRDCSDENQCGYHKESVMLGTPFTCDFEEGNCGWKDVSTFAYRWVTDRASIAMWGTGPSADHTRGTDLGWYMAAEMRRNTFAAIARLRSPVMQQAAATCEIRAWYQSHWPALWVELTYDNETRTLWQSIKSSISAWQELVAYTGRVPGEFQVRNQPSACSLDDVEFRSCGLPRKAAPPIRNCSRGSCVQLEQLCDGTDDCGDLSDESATECGECSPARESSAPAARGWRVGSVPRLESTRGQVVLGVNGDGVTIPLLWPVSCLGSYLGVALAPGQVVSVARARTPVLGPSGLACSVEMHYWLHSDPQGTRARWPPLGCAQLSSIGGGSYGASPTICPGHSTPGYFLSVDLSAQSTWGLSARLITYPQDPPTREQCLSFWYRLDGPQSGKSLPGCEFNPRGSYTGIWGKNLSEDWSCFEHRLIFEALRDGYLGNMALDDVTVRAGACGPQKSCSFEANACGFSSSWQYTWARQSNATGIATTGPSTDHTMGTARGYYMIVDTSKGFLPRGQAATLSSGQYRPLTGPQCLGFWYQLSPSDPGELGSPTPLSPSGWQVLFSVSSVQGDTWRYSKVTVQAAEDWQAVFEVVSAGGELSYVALDDLHLKAGSCPEPGSCDFESDTCGWTSPSDLTLSSYAWGWRSGASLGPKVDHTLGTTAGHYVYFDASVLGPRGNTAWLLSEHLPATMGACLRFWYHMHFPEHFYSGELRVKLYSMAGELTVWCARGHQGHGWRNRTISVQNTMEFQVMVGGMPRAAWTALAWLCQQISCHSPCSTPTAGSAVAAMVIGILLATVFLLLLACSMGCWLKRRVAAGRMPEERAASQGFDNIAFRDVRNCSSLCLCLGLGQEKGH